MLSTLNSKSIFVTMICLSLAACSGGKQEGQHAATETPASETLQAEIKSFDNVDPSVKAQLSGFLVDYFALNKALIEDNQDGAKVAAAKLSETVGKFDMSKLEGEQMDFYHVQMAKLNNGLKGISQSGDIEETRLDLVPVSEGIYALVKAYQPNQIELYYQFCPMAKNGEGANWLSETKEVINPYMGQRMLKCGNTQEVISQAR